MGLPQRAHFSQLEFAERDPSSVAGFARATFSYKGRRTLPADLTGGDSFH
jgi:hypothetical protein